MTLINQFFFFGSGTSVLWIIEESAGERLWLLALVTGGRWHVTCDLWKVLEKSQKGPKIHTKNTIKCQKLQRSVKKAGFHSIDATFRTHQESKCLSQFGQNIFSWGFSSSLKHFFLSKKNLQHFFLLNIFSSYHKRIFKSKKCLFKTFWSYFFLLLLHKNKSSFKCVITLKKIKIISSKFKFFI